MELNQIGRNIAENWEILVYIGGIAISVIFGRKKNLSKDEKLKLKEAKAHKRTEKREKAYKTALEEEELLKEKLKNDSSIQ